MAHHGKVTISSNFLTILVGQTGSHETPPVAVRYPCIVSRLEIIYLFLDKPFISVTFIFKEIGFLLDV